MSGTEIETLQYMWSAASATIPTVWQVCRPQVDELVVRGMHQTLCVVRRMSLGGWSKLETNGLLQIHLLQIHCGPSPLPVVESRHVNFIWRTRSLMATALAGDRVPIVVRFETLAGDFEVHAINCYAARSSRGVLEGRAEAKPKAEGK